MAVNERFPWVAVSAVVALVVVSAVAWLQIPDGEGRRDAAPLPALGLTRFDAVMSKELLAEQLEAYDPTPLFLPSPMNSSDPSLSDDTQSGVGGPFDVLPPELTKTGPLNFPPPLAIPQTAVGGLRLTDRAEAPLALARGDTAGAPLAKRFGQIEAVSMASGEVVLTLDLPAPSGLPPADRDLLTGDWQPLELMGAVTRAGVVGELVVTTSSGSGVIDEYFRSHLQKNVRIGARVSRGFYSFRVGP
jgi:hypothetical protein